MWEAITSIFRQKTAREMAAAELAEAERSRLMSMSAAEHAQASAQYHAQRIDRLRAYLAGEEQRDAA